MEQNGQHLELITRTVSRDFDRIYLNLDRISDSIKNMESKVDQRLDLIQKELTEIKIREASTLGALVKKHKKILLAAAAIIGGSNAYTFISAFF